MSASNSLEVHTEPGLVRASGEVDLATAGILRAALDGPCDVVVDLREVTFIDSTGIALLLETYGRCPGMTILPSPVVARVVALCGLRDTLPLQLDSGD